ncbi:MAG: hypothetical protein EPO32_10005 [Anaerolineae bacterium]|nr:MAG: hypothetical protein EPO32_10005 [Anaerolineae bacterium]
MEFTKRLNLEILLYGLAFALAFCLRLALLNAIPLAEFEAGWALQAYRLAHGAAVEFGPHPLYLLVTSFLFNMFGSGDPLARLLPALAGSLLPLVPFAFRGALGRWPAIILAFGLAIDPGLLAVSRLAGGPMPALAFLALAVAAWVLVRPAWAGVFFALAALSGPAFWGGVVGLVLAGLLFALLRREPLRLPGGDLRRAGLALLIMLALAGTLFLQVPGGLGAFAASLPAWVQGWGVPSGVPAGRLLVALVGYQPLALVFGLVAVVRLLSRPSARDLALLLWAVVALAIALLMPGRQVTDLIWVLVPLWALAAGSLADLLALRGEEEFSVVAGETSLLLIFYSFIWINLASLGTSAFQDPELLRIRLILSLTVFALALISAALIGIGWSFGEAARGILWSLALFLLFFTVNSATGAAYRRAGAAAELWWNGPAPGLTDRLATTVGDISEYVLGERSGLDVVVQTDSAAVAWALRTMPNVIFTTSLSPGLSDSALVTDSSPVDLLTEAGYRGQSFAVGWLPAWDGAKPPNWIGWLLFRQAPAVPSTVIVWGQAALFPGGAPVVALPQEVPVVEPPPPEVEPIEDGQPAPEEDAAQQPTPTEEAALEPTPTEEGAPSAEPSPSPTP